MKLDENLARKVRTSQGRPKDVIPNLLKALREDNMLSVQDVTSLLGYSGRSSYYKYENYERKMSIDKLDEFIQAITGKELRISIVDINSSAAKLES